MHLSKRRQEKLIKRTLNDLAEMIQIENDLSPYGKKEIQGVSINSREITPGQLFIPFKGERTDGHQRMYQIHRLTYPLSSLKIR